MQDGPDYAKPADQDFSDLDRWADGYEMKTGFAQGPESIPEGSYVFRITSAELAKTKTAKSFLRLGLIVVGGEHDGATLERASFLDSQEKANRLGGDLFKLGILDAPQWGNRDKPWSKRLLDTCPKLFGRRFRGTRKNREGDDGKTYYDLYIQSEMVERGKTPSTEAENKVESYAGSEKDIPF